MDNQEQSTEVSSIFDWQMEAWNSLCHRRSRLPHALLLFGRPGLGKSHLAFLFSKAILCQRSHGTMPACGICDSCIWFQQGNHPDFRLIQPESMNAELESNPDRKLSNQIKAEQVRDLESFFSVGTHRGGARIIMVSPADTMNHVTQNSLLKRLEEPSPGTLFLLATSHPDRLLPTIRSRCQALPVLVPSRQKAEVWLSQRGALCASELLESSAGAPLAALKLADSGEARNLFASRLSEENFDPLALAAACGGMDPAVVINWIQCWVHDIAVAQLVGKPRFFPRHASELNRLSANLSLQELSGLYRRLSKARTLATHPLNPKLYFESLFMEYGHSLRHQ